MPGARAYLAGLLLALLLTAIPFAIVQFRLLDAGPAAAGIAIAAVLQILVHLRCFLGLSLTDTPRENLLALAFATLLIAIMVGGSLWIMLDLNSRMMP